MKNGMATTEDRRGILALTLVGLIVGGFGLAPLAGAVYDYIPDLLTPERDYEEVPWTYEREEGPHLALHYRTPHSFPLTGVARVVDADGNDLLHVYAGHGVYVSDGYDEEGEIRFINAGWANGRADITLNGSTYLFHHDRSDPVEARLFTNATSGAFADPSTVVESGRTVEVLRERVYGPDAEITAFRGPADLLGWDVHAPAGEVYFEDGLSHYRGWGRLIINAGRELEDLTYMYRPAPDAPYVAEASFRPLTADLAVPSGVPDHQAVLAGVSGSVEDPEVDWALVMAHGASEAPRGKGAGQSWLGKALIPDDPYPAVPGQYDYWSLYFVDAAGTRTQVVPTWGGADDRWHGVRAYVDPESGTVEVQVDDNSTALRFDAAFTGTSDRIAVGDVWHGDAGMWWTGGRMGRYDNLVVEPVEDEI